jgi:hypothetical protein
MRAGAAQFSRPKNYFQLSAQSLAKQGSKIVVVAKGEKSPALADAKGGEIREHQFARGTPSAQL